MSFGTAHAEVKTVTYTFTDERLYRDSNGATKRDCYFTATGDINTTYTVDFTGAGGNTFSWTMGDFSFNWTSGTTYFSFVILGKYCLSGTIGYENWTFTVSSNKYYIDNVKYYNNVDELRIEQDNESKSCAITTSNQAFGSVGFGIHALTVTYSDSPAYKITYNLNGGTNSANNPDWYETNTGVTLADPTRRFYGNYGMIADDAYEFGGWYDNENFTGSPITAISAGQTGAKTLYAKWTPHSFSISYELNGGTNPSNARTSYTVETSTFNLPTPTRNGYDFKGWYLDEDFAGANYAERWIKQGYKHHRDLTFYAKWEKWNEDGDGTLWNPFKIRNEADLRALATLVDGGDTCGGKYYQQTADITITGGDWTPIGNYSNSDHYFSGNYDGGGFTISGININSTNSYQGLFGKVTGIENQKRGFIQNIVLVNSNIAGGSYTGGIVGYLNNAHVKNCHVSSDVTVTGTSGKSGTGGVVGYFSCGTVTNCTGMATVSTGTGVGGIIGYMKKQSSTTATANDCFSYGKAPIGKTVSGTATNVEQVYSVGCADSSITLPDEVSDTDGFLYDGVHYYKKGAKVLLTVNLNQREGYEIEVKYGSTVVTPDDYGMYILTVPAANVTLTAQEKPIVYTISCYLEGGTVGTANPESYTIESYDFTLNNPTKDGYDFAGWTGIEIDEPAMSITIPTGSTGDRSYTANFTTIIYKISYDLYGGEFEDKNYPVSYDINSEVFTLPTPARLGYTFTGWALSEDSSIEPSTEVTIETGTTGNRTYLAGWQIITYTISYNLDGGELADGVSNPASYTVNDEITLNNPAKNWYVFGGWNGTCIENGTMTVEIPQGSTGNRSYSATWQEENTPKIAFHSLLLGGQLGVMFYIYAPTNYDPSKFTANFEVSGETLEYNQNKKYSRTSNSDGVTFYGFECRINSAQMADDIYASINYGENEAVSEVYSVERYLDTAPADTEDYELDLYEAIRDYGHFVQPMLAKVNNWTINEKYAEMKSNMVYSDDEIARVSDAVAGHTISRDTTGSDINDVKFSLVLGSNTTINLYLNVLGDYSGEVSAVIDDGDENKAEYLSTNQYKVQITDIPAHRLDKVYNVKVTTESGNFTVKVSALSYVKAVLDEDEDEDEINAAVSLYRYFETAKAYAVKTKQM